MAADWRRAELSLLAGTFLFRGTDPALVRRAAEDPRCTRETFPKGARLYSPRHFRRSLGVVLEGTVRVTKGRLVVSALGPGELFGAAALFHSRDRYETTLTARTPCTAAFLPQDLVEELLGESRVLCRNYIGYLSDRIHFLNRRIEGLTTPGAVGKLSRYLLEEGRRGGELSCCATELARRLDVSRASLYRAFEELEAAGAIRREGKRLFLLDREGLEARL